MRFSLTEDDEMIVASIGELCAKSVAPHASQWDDDGALPPAILTEVAGLGLAGMSASEAVGGVALSAVGRAAALQALASGDAALALLLAAHDGLAAAHVARGGTAAQREAHLAAWAAGERFAAWAEPAETLQIDADGDVVRLAGHTGPTVAAGIAGHWLVHAPADGGVRSVLVPADTAGASATPVDRLGARAAATAVLHFDGVQLPAASLVGAVDDGLVDALRAEHWVDLAAIATGVGRAALQAATAYAREREQFGQPIANFQAIQWMLANAATELDAAALLTGKAAWHIAGGGLDVAAAARAKTHATEAAQRAASDALQIHGGYGYTREFPVERHLRAAKTLAVAGGTNRTTRAAAADPIAGAR
ncbi:MAG: acyl-CoA dehydrogenase family protein [Myxococcota bacterium]